MGSVFGGNAIANAAGICRCLLIGSLFFGFASASSADSWRVISNRTDSSAGGLPPQEEIVMYDASYALVIGIDRYTNGWPRLKNAIQDAQAVATALTKVGFSVELETDLTAASLERKIKQFFVRRGSNPEARLLLWFAGHGATLDGEGFLVPLDAPTIDHADFKLRGLHMRDFGSYVCLARAKHVLAVFDSCFSGTIFDARRGAAPAAITRSASLPVRQFLTSGDAQQEVLDDGSFRSVFLEALESKGPADANRDGYVTGSEIGIYIADRVTNLTNAVQTPRFGKLNDREYDRGDFVLSIPAHGGKASPVAVQESDDAGGASSAGVVRVQIRGPSSVPSELETNSAPTQRRRRSTEKSYTELIEDAWDRQTRR